MDKEENIEILRALNFCLGSIISELNISENKMKLYELDLQLIEQVQGVYFHFSEKYRINMVGF